jgi:MFS family permease
MRTFLVIWGGQVVSEIGTAMTRFALLIWIYEQTGRATDVALLGFFAFVPLVVLSPFAGVWVDRRDRRLIMMLADAGAGLMTVLVLALYLTGGLRVWHLYVAEAMTGVFGAFQSPAFTAATTTLVPAEQYGRTGGLRAITMFGADSVAPFAAGIVLVSVGITGVLLIDVLTFLVAVATLASVRVPHPAAATGGATATGFGAELAAGARYLRGHRGLLGLMVIFTGINLIGTLTYLSVLPPMILARTAKNTIALASVQSTMGVAAVIGGALMAVWGGPRRKIHGVLAGGALSFLAGDLLFAIGRDLAAWLVAGFIGSLLIPVMMASDQAIWQKAVPPALQGRVLSLYYMVRRSSMPVGYLLGGVLADRVFEPAMRPEGALAPSLGWLVGVGPGAGMAAMFLFTAFAGTLMCLGGYAIPAVRDVDSTR